MTVQDFYKEIKNMNFSNVSDIVKLTYNEDVILRKQIVDILNHNLDDEKIDLDLFNETEKAEFFKQKERINAGDAKGTFSIPSDILFSKMLPIKGLEIICDDTKEGGEIISYSVCFMDNYKEIIDTVISEGYGSRQIIGKVETTRKMKGDIVVFLEVGYGINSLMLYTLPKNENDFKFFSVEKAKEVNSFVLEELLPTWYAIQINLLHPDIKEIFEKPQIMKIPIHSKSTSSKKRTTKYIRMHKINADELGAKLKTNINRKCLCWYVIGHWREYKNGKKTFIQGYWKGALRNTKKNYDSGRERVIEVL